MVFPSPLLCNFPSSLESSRCTLVSREQLTTILSSFFTLREKVIHKVRWTPRFQFSLNASLSLLTNQSDHPYWIWIILYEVQSLCIHQIFMMDMENSEGEGENGAKNPLNVRSEWPNSCRQHLLNSQSQCCLPVDFSFAFLLLLLTFSFFSPSLSSDPDP